MQKQETEKQFEQHIKENELLIYKVCRIYAYTAADREDLFQEIIVQLWKSVPKFQGQSKFSTWVYRVALNTAISDFRKKKRSVPVSSTEGASIEIGQEPGNDIEKHEQADALYAAISQLTEIDKAIVMLYLENKSYEEMEDILGISQGTLRVKMTRIKEKLRQLAKKIDYGT